MRATQVTTYRTLLAQLNKQGSRMSDLQVQAATGKRIQRPSDDPGAIRPVLNARTQIKSAEQYGKTIEAALDRVDNTDIYLDHMENLLVRAKEISIASVNGALNAADRETYADEISQIRQELFDAANAQLDGKYIFAGFKEKTTPMVKNPDYPAFDTRPVLYAGDSGAMNLEIGPGIKVQVNLTGNDLRLVEAFETLAAVEEALRNDNPSGVGAQMANLEDSAEQIRRQRSELGNTGNRLETARGHMEEIELDMREILSRYEDADILEVLANMKQQETALEAALNVTAKISELSILDFI